LRLSTWIRTARLDPKLLDSALPDCLISGGADRVHVEGYVVRASVPPFLVGARRLSMTTHVEVDMRQLGSGRLSISMRLTPFAMVQSAGVAWAVYGVHGSAFWAFLSGLALYASIVTFVRWRVVRFVLECVHGLSNPEGNHGDANQLP